MADDAVPTGWTAVTLGSITQSAVDGPFGSSLKTEHYVDTPGVRVIRLQNIGSGSFLDEDHAYISDAYAGTLGRHDVVGGDLLVASLGDNAHPVARACQYPDGFPPAIVKADCFRLRFDNSSVDSSFVKWVLNSPNTRLGFAALARGVTRDRVNLGSLAKFFLVLPPIAEQRKIVDVLDAIDESIRSTERLITKLEKAKRAMLHHLLTCGLDSQGRSRDPRNSPHSFKSTSLGLLPATWEVCSLEDLLADVSPAMRSGPFGSALLNSELVEHGIPLLGIDNVHIERFVPEYRRFVSPEKYAELSRYAVRPRDLMVTIMGTVGRCCVVPDNIGIALSSKHVWTLTIDQARYIPELVCLQINYCEWVLDRLGQDTQGGIMSAIRSETLRSVMLPVPPLVEQEKIWGALKSVQGKIDAESAELSGLHQTKQGLMDDLLTGRVRVNLAV